MKIKELENLITSVYDNDIKSIRIEKNQSKVTINKNNLKIKPIRLGIINANANVEDQLDNRIFF